MALPPPVPLVAPSPAPATRQKSSTGWIVGIVVAFAAFWAVGEWLRSSDVREADVKAVLATVAMGLALVQIATMTVVYRSKAPGTTKSLLSRVHRISGRAAVATLAFVGYLCISAPLPEGYSWHRLFGFALAAVLLAKVVIVRGVARLGSVLPVLGLGAAALLVAQWVTKALDVLSS